MSSPAKNVATWGLLFIAGVIFFSVGVLAFINPMSSYVKLTKFAGIGLLLNGGLLLAMIIIRPMRPRERNWLQAESILHLFFGILFLLNPLLAFIALPYFIGSWLFLVGLLKMLAALALRHRLGRWGFIVFVGLIFFVFGSLLLFSPFARATSITLIIGCFGIIMGAFYMIDAFRYRKMEDTLDMLL
ncbi:HdeD family acid-resistance protein [Puia dinghuensis]|uniref:DUF308 domain-containing protein n=1 Tax=Puia dinghuensis TaxID=1792502 RepID=A0A8J2U846_9BACT|nr:DUF308 domain-containing protein [Puia dinghuensis]GGA85423.1 hypothetical protein GCM10011511_05580 [Puia dinghuensis]